jgi:hypothetical protein
LDTVLPGEVPDIADDEVVFDAETGLPIDHPTIPVADNENALDSDGQKIGQSAASPIDTVIKPQP